MQRPNLFALSVILIFTMLSAFSTSTKAEEIPQPTISALTMDYYCDFERESPRYIKCNVDGDIVVSNLNDLNTAAVTFELSCEDGSRELNFRDLAAKFSSTANGMIFLAKAEEQPAAQLTVQIPNGKFAVGKFPATLAVGGLPTLKSSCDFSKVENP